MNNTAAWLEVARNSRKAAYGLIRDYHRSCVSRAYYAAYARLTHELVHVSRVSMPFDRDGPSHTGIRPLIENNWPGANTNNKKRLSRLIGRLYTMRRDADYKPETTIDAREAREAISIMNKIFDLC